MPKSKTPVKALTGQPNDFLKIVAPAASRGHIEAVESYLDSVPGYLKYVGPHGRTLLWEASRNNKPEMVRKLIGMGANVEQHGCYFRETIVEISPLCVAASRGHQEIVEILRDSGAEYRIETACFLGDLEFVDKALKKRSSLAKQQIDIGPVDNQLFPVHYAIAGNNIAIVERLIEDGADVTGDGGRLLSWSFGFSGLVIARRLLREGAVPRPGDVNEASLDDELAPVLREFGYTGDINAPNRLGFPALVEACRGNHNAEEDTGKIAMLLDQGADVNIRDYKEKTALHRAAQAGFSGVIKQLVDHGADPNFRDENGETPLFDAIRAGREEAARVLLASGADPLLENRLGQTAALLAKRGRRSSSKAIAGMVAQSAR